MEEFKDIPGYEGFYQISDLGNILSLERKSPKAVANGVRVAKRSIVPHADKQGRVYVCLSKYGQQKKHLLNRLVLETFEGPCPEGMECRRLNRDPMDNRLVNLRWVSCTENRWLEEDHPRAKLTKANVKDIRARQGLHKPSDLAREYGVSTTTIGHVLSRRTWKDV